MGQQAEGLSAERTIEELRRLAYSDIGQCGDAHGNLLPMTAMSPEARTAVRRRERRHRP